MLRLLPIIFLCSLLTILGCSPSLYSPSEFKPLRNRGIQVLSNSNPYHGPNLVLGRAIEESSNLAGYFHHRGAPIAIEVKHRLTKKEEIYLYYPDSYEAFVARPAEEGEKREWMIDGPYKIGRNDYRRLRNHIKPEEKSPVFIVFGDPVRFGDQPTDRVQMASILEPVVPLIAKPQPKRKKIVKKKPKPVQMNDSKNSTYVKARLPRFDDPKFIPQNSDQTALMLSQGYAKRAPNGDILHEIEGNAQTLENITHWYMGSTSLIPELQEANNFPEAQKNVRKGTVVRIPVEFIKNTKQMPMNHRVRNIGEENKKKMGPMPKG